MTTGCSFPSCPYDRKNNIEGFQISNFQADDANKELKLFTSFQTPFEPLNYSLASRRVREEKSSNIEFCLWSSLFILLRSLDGKSFVQTFLNRFSKERITNTFDLCTREMFKKRVENLFPFMFAVCESFDFQSFLLRLLDFIKNWIELK